MERNIIDVSASVHARLLTKAKAENRPFQEVLVYYAMERFLYRLSLSPYQDTFILKGALLLQALFVPSRRPTRDIDLAGKLDNDPQHVAQVIREICQTEVETDGLRFDQDSVEAEPITLQDEYQGVRLKFLCLLERAKVHMQIDIGIGDLVVPEPKLRAYPTILDLPAPMLYCYPVEATVAEKFEAMVSLGLANTRLKDFYDIWLISTSTMFSRDILVEAISSTFKKRGTQLSPKSSAFSEEFSLAKKSEWSAFLKRTSIDGCPTEFVEIQAAISQFLSPIVIFIIDGTESGVHWEPGGPWQGE